jgi:zinicin-like metallopeptidase
MGLSRLMGLLATPAGRKRDLPGRISARRPGSSTPVADQVRRTVIHEIAHHFGIDDNRLSQLGW